MNSTSLFIAMAAVIVAGAILSLHFGRETRWLKQPDAIAAPTMGTVALLFGLFVTFGSSDAVLRGR